MICPNCGAELTEETKFCTTCGTPQNAPTPAQTPVEAPVETPVEAPKPASFVSNIDPKKEKKHMSKGKKLLLAIGIPVLIIAIAAALCLTVLKPTLTKWFCSPEKYLREVEKADGGLYDGAELLGKAYGKLVSGEAFKGDTDIQIKPNEALLSLLGDSADLSWLKSLGIKTSADSADDNVAFKLDLALNESELVSLVARYNTKTGEIIAAVPALSDKYIKMSLADLLESVNTGNYLRDWDEYDVDDYYDIEWDDDYYNDDTVEPTYDQYIDDDTDDITMIGGAADPEDIIAVVDSIAKDVLLALPEFKNALPSEKVFNRIANRYLDIVFNNLGEVTRGEEEVTAQNVTEKLDVLYTTIDYATAVKIVKAVLEQIKTDEDIKKVVNDFCTVINNIDEEADVSYEDFIEAIDTALGEIENDSENNNSVVIKVKVYVRDGKVTGRSFVIGNDEGGEISFNTLETRKDENFGYEMKIDADEQTLSVTSGGTVKDEHYTCDIALALNDTDIFEVSMTDTYLDRDTLSLIGTYTASFTSDFSNMIGEGDSNISDIISKLKITVTSLKNKRSIDFSAMGIKALTIDVTSNPEPSFKAKEFKTPADDDCVNIETADDFGTWAESIDISKIPEILKNAGIPEELLIALAGELIDA